MEAPFRYPITGLADVERLLDNLATSPHFVPGSLRIAEGQELLIEQLTTEDRVVVFLMAHMTSDFRVLMRALWQQPLHAQRPRFLRFKARLVSDPSLEISMRIDVPTTGEWPRWVDLEGSRDPAMLARLRTLYKSIGREAQLTLVAV